MATQMRESMKMIELLRIVKCLVQHDFVQKAIKNNLNYAKDYASAVFVQ